MICAGGKKRPFFEKTCLSLRNAGILVEGGALHPLPAVLDRVHVCGCLTQGSFVCCCRSSSSISNGPATGRRRQTVIKNEGVRPALIHHSSHSHVGCLLSPNPRPY